MDSGDRSQVTFLSMNLPVIVINKFFNESFIFFLHLISHVRDIAQNSLILHLKRDQIQLRKPALADSLPGCVPRAAPVRSDPQTAQGKAEVQAPRLQLQMSHHQPFILTPRQQHISDL